MSIADAESRYGHEYVSATVSLGPITAGSDWSLDFYLPNRGATVESFRVFVIRRGVDHDVVPSPEYNVNPGEVGAWAVGFEVEPGVIDVEQRWARIFTTSLNLVPTMRFHVTAAGDAAPPFPPVYFAPGDFASFAHPSGPLAPLPADPQDA